MIKVVVFNNDAGFAPKLREQLHTSRDARIVAELVKPEELIPSVERLNPDVVVIHLHPKPDDLLTLAGRLSRTHQNVRIFGIADSDDPQLILTSMRSGMSEFLTKPVDQEELNLALSKVAALKPAGAGKGEILAMVGSSGGCGATFLAVNAACELVNRCRQSAVVVDLDVCGGQVATHLDLTPTFTLGDMAEGSETPDRQMLERIIIRHRSGVAVIARPSSLAQGELLQNSSSEKLITTVVSSLTDMYDYVILDGLNPTREGHLGLLRMTDHILLIMNLLVPSIRNGHRLLEAMTQRHGLEQENRNMDSDSTEPHPSRILLVINRVGRESGYLQIPDVEKTLHRQAFALIPDDWRAVSRSINAGDPLHLYSPNSKPRAGVVEMCLKLTGQTGEEDRRGWSGAGRDKAPGLFEQIFHGAKRSGGKERGTGKKPRGSLVGSD